MLTLLLALSTSLLSVSASAADPVLLNGAGATFPYPLYSKWFSDYRKVDPSVEINYTSVGSGGGIRQLIDGTIDFGASDAPMTAEQTAKAQEKQAAAMPILHLPMVLGAVVLTYNLPDVKAQLKFSPEVLADLFLGKIKKWGDERIAALNPGVKFPKDLDIAIVHRSDASGTSAIFTDYLSKVSPEWKTKVGAGTALKWPAGLGGKGNEGVTGVIKNTPGTIGYVEFVYAEANKLPVALLKNKAGVFTAPSVKAVTAAAAGALKEMPEDFKLSLTDSAGKDAYPISGFTYLLVYNKMDAVKGKKLAAFLKWALTEGQKQAEPLSYAPLPKSLAVKVEKKVLELKTQ